MIKGVLKSIKNLVIPQNYKIEYLIIDNNSTNNWFPKLSSEIRNFPFQILIEQKQGLTFSRIKGFELAKGDWIVCVDDDNELDSDYLFQLEKLASNYPEVGVWGPGKIKVKFHRDAPNWVENYKAVFQERDFKEIQFGKERAWMPYYPSGTGMCLHKSVAKAYFANIKSGKMTATDRKGKSLSSGGDSQVVYSGILIDQAAGVAPGLKVNHLIGPTKTILVYMKKLSFGVFSSWPVHVEVFPEITDRIPKPSTFSFLKLVFVSWVKSRFGKNPQRFLLPLSIFLGSAFGYYQVHQRDIPFIYRWFIRKLRLQ